MTRVQAVERALEEERPLSFVYMKLGEGLAGVERRRVLPARLFESKDGHQVLTAEDLDKSAPRNYRLERMYHVNVES